VPATPIRRRATRALLAGLIAITVLSGCTEGQKAPGSYSGAEDNFLEGCVKTATDDNEKDNDQGEVDPTRIVDPQGYCQCSFDAVSAEGGVPYSEFKEIQSRMQDEGGPLPTDYLDVVNEACDPSSEDGKKAGATDGDSDSGTQSDSSTTTTSDASN